MSGKTRQINIRGEYGWRAATIDALVYGAFAIHPFNHIPRRRWQGAYAFVVTHIATGRTVGGTYSRRDAQEIAQALNAVLPEGNFTEDDFNTERYHAFTKQATKVIVGILSAPVAAGPAGRE